MDPRRDPEESHCTADRVQADPYYDMAVELEKLATEKLDRAESGPTSTSTPASFMTRRTRRPVHGLCRLANAGWVAHWQERLASNRLAALRSAG
jgi:hypothetical protein